MSLNAIANLGDRLIGIDWSESCQCIVHLRTMALVHNTTLLDTQLSWHALCMNMHIVVLATTTTCIKLMRKAIDPITNCMILIAIVNGTSHKISNYQHADKCQNRYFFIVAKIAIHTESHSKCATYVKALA